jgi:hypothetical protein
MNMRHKPRGPTAQDQQAAEEIAYAVMIHCTASAESPPVSMDGSARDVLKSRTMNAGSG